MFKNFLLLNSWFPLFLEFFLSINFLYGLIIFTLILKNIYRLLLEMILSEFCALIFLMSFFLILNDNFFFGNFYFNFFDNNLKIVTIINDYNVNCFFFFDNLSIIAKGIILIFSFLFFIFISDNLKKFKLNIELLFLLNFNILGLIFMCFVNDFLLIYLSIELVSISSYLLSSFRKNSYFSIESGIKYLIVGAISSSFFLFGFSLIYYYSGSFYLFQFLILFDNLNLYYFFKKFSLINYNVLYLISFHFNFFVINNSPINFQVFLRHDFFCKIPIIEIGLSLILISLFIKLSIAPFHLWSIDVYEGTPTIVTFFYIILTKLSFLIILFRINICFLEFYYEVFNFYFLILGFLSIILGCLANLKHKKIKTFMAYSTVNHLGYIILCFSTFSNIAVESVIYYLIVYMFTNLLFFFCILILRESKNNYIKKKHFNTLGDFFLLNKLNPVISFGLMIAIFSSAGVPPFVGFFSKLNIFLTLILTKYFFITVCLIIFSMSSSFYYIRLIKILYFENLIINKFLKPLKNNKSIVFCFLIFILVFFAFKPLILYLIIHYIFLILFLNPLEYMYLNECFSILNFIIAKLIV